MKHFLNKTIAFLTIVYVSTVSANLEVPLGFEVQIIAEKIGPARHLAVRDNGDIYVHLQALQNGGAIAALRDTNGDGKIDIIRYFEDKPGTGIHIFNDFLYFTTNTAVYRKKLTDELVPTSPTETMVSGFPDQSSHQAKALAFDNSGKMWVSVGAPSNACQKRTRTPGSLGLMPCPQLKWQASIWQFDANKTRQSLIKDGYKYASGIRHAVAMEWNPISQGLYVVQHGRDQLNDLWPRYYSIEDNAELPSEEFLLVTKDFVGGWPYSYWDHRKNARMLAPEYGGDGQKQIEEGKYPKPIYAFPGHYAPNDLLFYTGKQFPPKYREGAFIAFHGSWNRAPLPQKGYHVAFLPFSGRFPKGDAEIFASGFIGRMPLANPNDAKYRPMGLAMGGDGSLYIADSVKGTLWRISYIR